MKYGITFTCGRLFQGYVRIITSYRWDSTEEAIEFAQQHIENPRPLDSTDFADLISDEAGDLYEGPWYALIEDENTAYAEVHPDGSVVALHNES